MNDQWFAFKAYNSQTLYGFGSEHEASTFADWLNRGREINHYHHTPVSSTEGEGMRLDARYDCVSLADELGAIQQED